MREWFRATLLRSCAKMFGIGSKESTLPIESRFAAYRVTSPMFAPTSANVISGFKKPCRNRITLKPWCPDQ